jgi:hypothetical protein
MDGLHEYIPFQLKLRQTLQIWSLHWFMSYSLLWNQHLFKSMIYCHIEYLMVYTYLMLWVVVILSTWWHLMLYPVGYLSLIHIKPQRSSKKLHTWMSWISNVCPRLWGDYWSSIMNLRCKTPWPTIGSIVGTLIKKSKSTGYPPYRV